MSGLWVNSDNKQKRSESLLNVLLCNNNKVNKALKAETYTIGSSY